MKKNLFLRQVFSAMLLLVSLGLKGQLTIAATSAASLVINEVDYDQPGSDTAEFVEIKNISLDPIDLDPYAIRMVNGSSAGASVYRTIDLPAHILQPGDYYVVCANMATVPDCDLDGGPDTDLIQNGAPDALAIVQDEVIIDTVSYGGDTSGGYTEGSGMGLLDDPNYADRSIGRCLDGNDTDQNNLDFIFRPSTPGAENDCPSLGACGDPATKISTVQGSGSSSLLEGEEHILEGVVVGDFQHPTSGLGGFFLQEEPEDVDGNPSTSEGIFIRDNGAGLDVAVGDVVRVVGLVSELGGLTQLSSIGGKLVCSHEKFITPTQLSLPVNALSHFETYEGMLVTFPQTLYIISEYFNFDRYGEVVLTSQRQYHPRRFIRAGFAPEASQTVQANLLGRITLDDGRSAQNPDPAIHPNGAVFDLTNLFRGGDILMNVTGVLDFAFGLYRIQPTQGANFLSANSRPAAG
jgi:uncharacterized protein